MARICNLLGLKRSLFDAWKAGTEGGGEGGREGRGEERGGGKRGEGGGEGTEEGQAVEDFKFRHDKIYLITPYGSVKLL